MHNGAMNEVQIMKSCFPPCGSQFSISPSLVDSMVMVSNISSIDIIIIVIVVIVIVIIIVIIVIVVIE